MTVSDDGWKCEALKPLSLSLTLLLSSTNACTDTRDCDTDTAHCPSGPCVILVEAEVVVTSEFPLKRLSVKTSRSERVSSNRQLCDFKPKFSKIIFLC